MTALPSSTACCWWHAQPSAAPTMPCASTGPATVAIDVTGFVQRLPMPRPNRHERRARKFARR